LSPPGEFRPTVTEASTGSASAKQNQLPEKRKEESFEDLAASKVDVMWP
ncbi:hypothetical protein BAE44_0001380, partial [Dichanthelium oligosanthes]